MAQDLLQFALYGAVLVALAIPLGVLGSLTEFWMAGDWRGIPREKERQRKPEDNMGI